MVCCYLQMTAVVMHSGRGSLLHDVKFLNSGQKSCIPPSRSSRFASSGRDYSCEICGKRAVNKFNLDRHRNVHLGVRPYQCALCGFTSTQKKNVVSHLLSKHHMDKMAAKSLVLYQGRHGVPRHSRTWTRKWRHVLCQRTLHLFSCRYDVEYWPALAVF